jgi:hypothetical protein
MLFCYYSTKSTNLGTVEESPEVWSKALAKHLPAIVRELKDTSCDPNLTTISLNFGNKVLHKTQCYFLWDSFSYVGVAPAEELFVSMLQDQAFLRNLAAIEYCVDAFASWISNSSCQLSENTITTIIEVIKSLSSDEDELDKEIAGALLCNLADKVQLSNKWIDQKVHAHPKLTEVRALVIEMLRRGLKVKSQTIDDMLCPYHNNILDHAVSIVKSLKNYNDSEALGLAIDLLEMLLDKYDAISSYQ